MELLKFFIVFALHVAACHSLFIDLYPGDMRCIGQELDQLEPVVFAMSASSKVRDLGQKVMAKISDPDNEDLFYDKIAITGKIKEYQYKVDHRGVYEMCFELQDGKTPVRVFFHVDYKPLDADGKDNSRQLNKDDVPTLHSDLQLIERQIREISEEIEHAKRQEAYLIQANEATASSIQWFSYLSIVVLLGTSVWQIVYLRSFFSAKKLL